MPMEIKSNPPEGRPPEFYRERRLEKKKKRKEKTVKRAVVFTVLFIAVFVIYFVVARSSNKPSDTSDKQSVVPDNKLKKKTKKDILLAYNDKIKIYMPYDNKEFTGLGYHSAFNPLAQNFTPIGREINTKKMPREKAFSILRNTKNISYAKMSRSSRNGRQFSSIDIGAKAGAIVKSLVNGKVALVRKYKLYGYIDDYEIHIFPDGYKDRHLVIIHIADIKVKKGDIVKRGKTPLARVRRLSSRIKNQLREYTKEKGDHIHVQVNKLGKNGLCTIRDNQ